MFVLSIMMLMLVLIAYEWDGLTKHPGVYMEALFAHVYGWFSPEISNSLRYEAEHDLIRRGGLFPNAEKCKWG